MNLDDAIVYDVETLPNVFTFAMEGLFNDTRAVWEISEYRDDRHELLIFFDYLMRNQIPMVGFNNVYFDYVVIHFIITHPNCTVAEIYAVAMSIIEGDRFGNTIWPSDRLIPQIDLFLINHFNNKAKTTSLKALQFNMRSPTIVDSPVVFGTRLTLEQVLRDLIPYNQHDVKETKRFAHFCMSAIRFRAGIVGKFGPDVMNYNDVKIGVKTLEQRLGDDVCYDRSTGRKQPRQTPRHRIALNEIIFPYIKFEHPELQRVLAFMKAQTLTPDDLEDPDAKVKTKGVFTNLVAEVGGVEFHFGTGGIHGSVPAQRFAATEEWLLRDIDVEGLYPNIAIVNKLAPEHLGEAFTAEYSRIPVERKTHAKGTYENASLKLAANGPWGQSNNQFSVFYDPKYAMTIPINGQLMTSMLAAWLITVPTFQLIQINTDGITYRIHRDYEPQAASICKQWEAYTCLKLEDANYRRMWIRDVNNYIAEDMKGKLKQKGAYWHPTPGADYGKSISEASPPAWHKDLGNIISIRAAVAAMVHGIDPETFIKVHTDPFDFMCRVKVGKADRLLLGGVELQRTSRYYVARQGSPMTIIRPPSGPEGAYKRKAKVSEAEYTRVMQAGGWAWNEAVCTGKAGQPKTWGTYEKRVTAVEAGWLIAECNDASRFDFANVNYDYYIAEARKLIIA